VADEDLLDTVAVAVSDGAPIDWASAEESAEDGDKALVRHLRMIAALAAAERPSLSSALTARDHPPGSWLFQAALAIAGVKVGLAAVGWMLTLTGTGPSQPWPYITNLAVFAVASVVLFSGGRDESAARHLGAFFLVIASAFSDRLLLGLAQEDVLGPLVVLLRGLAADAFIAFALWRFVWAFPAPPVRAIDRRVMRALLRASLAVGAVLLAANAVLALGALGVSLSGLATWAVLLDRGSGGGYYSFALFGVAAPALPYLLWKSRLEPRDERRRAAIFAGSLVAGVAPMLIAVLISPFVSFFDTPSNRDLVGIWLHVCLLSVVPLTAYAVLVHRVIDFGLLVTKAMKHGMVRYAVWLATLAPFAYLALLVYFHRDLAVAEIARGDDATAFLFTILLCLAAPPLRRLVLRAADLRFLGAPPDYPVVLARLERDLRDAHGVREVTTALERATRRAIRPGTCAVLVIDENRESMISPSGSARPLAMTSTLGRLLELAREEIVTGADAAGPVARLLPDEDRRWLTAHEFQLIVPLVGSRSDLLGVIAIGGKDGGLPFANADRLLLATMAGQAAVVIENRCFREPSYRHMAAGAGRRGPTIDWNDEPASLCPACHMLWPSRTVTCDCGAGTVPAALPLVVAGKFRVLRLIGAGGMGVVYLAIDVALDRKVAIKTLPRLTSERVVRLQREARAMATAPHPNLAMIFGVESWRGAPLLVVEYLEGGTLADRQTAGCLSADEAAALGAVLADVLDQVHASGVLHRDIKPSNIGYTRDGVPKLLDFGIASMLEATNGKQPARAGTPSPAEAEPAAGPASAAAFEIPLTGVDQIPGTPLYLCPEALDGAEPDPSFDLWSLSLVLYEAIGGFHPFRAATVEEVFQKIRHAEIPDIQSIRPGTPPLVAALFARALSRDRSERPQSAAELRNWLQYLRSELRVSARFECTD
jgi:hypothetical protein